MKILVFCYEFPPLGGGTGNALYHLSREWGRLGHLVTVVTSHYQGAASTEFVEGVKLIRLRVGRRHLHRGSKREMVFFGFKATLLAGSFFRSEKPDVCVTFMTVPGGGFAPFWLKWFHGVPWVTEVRGADMPGYDPLSLKFHHWIARPFIRFSWIHSRAVICVNRMFVELLKKNFPSVSPVVQIPNGVDSDFFVPAPQKKTDETLRLLFVGRFVDSQKNITTLLRALAGTDKVVLCLAGAGPDEKKIRQLASTLGISGKVRFAGWLDKQELLRAYQHADVYVSAASSEGMPNTALEAMACGLPVVLSDIAGHRELVVNGKNGFLFPSGDANALAQFILDLKNNPELRFEMGKRSRQKILMDHDWKKLAREHIACFS